MCVYVHACVCVCVRNVTHVFAGVCQWKKPGWTRGWENVRVKYIFFYIFIVILNVPSGVLSPCVKGNFSFLCFVYWWIIKIYLIWFDLKKQVCMIVFPCYKHGSGPAYLSKLLHVYTPSRTLRSSSDTRMLKIEHKRKIWIFRFVSCFGPPHLEFTPTRPSTLVQLCHLLETNWKPSHPQSTSSANNIRHCVCVCVRACVRVCMCVCVRVCVRTDQCHVRINGLNSLRFYFLFAS